MHLVGVDLAWGTRRRSGVAALDADGRLLDLGDVRTDDELLGWVSRWASGPCIVGIDAPIVVRNPTGTRDAERLLGRHFRRFDAGPHPANTGIPAFAGGDTRALRLVRALDLDRDPLSGADRLALEVYPHAATVALMGLPKVLRYKHKSGRDLPLLQAELLRLVELLEGLERADPPMRLREHPGWQRIRAAVEGAARKSELRAVEDAVDAVVCAYVALYALRRPDRVRVFGTAEDGCIVTPVTPQIAAEVDRDAR